MALEISWYGQAMFTIRGEGKTVCVDPVSPETGYEYGQVDADLVLVSHEHYDHNYVEGVRGYREVLRGSGVREFDGLKITGLPCFHDEEAGALRGENTIFTWEMEKMKLAHLGDLGHTPDPETMDTLSGLDIIMIPVGGVFTIDGSQAAGLAALVAPTLVIPMHYSTPHCNVGVDKLDLFVRDFEGDIKRVDERPLRITSGSLPRSTEAWVIPCR